MNKRRILFSAAAILLLIAIAACMMVIGRGHTMYFDNKKLEYEGQTYDTYRRINVFVGGEQVAKLSAKDRGMATFMGQKLSFDIEVTKEKGDEPVTYTFPITVPYGMDGIVLNLPETLLGISSSTRSPRCASAKLRRLGVALASSSVAPSFSHRRRARSRASYCGTFSA